MRPFLLSLAFSFSIFVFIYICSLVANMVLLVGQLTTMFPKPKHLKHFILEVLVGDLVVEVKMWSLETFWCVVISFEEWEGKDFLYKCCLYPSLKICRSHHYEYL